MQRQNIFQFLLIMTLFTLSTLRAESSDSHHHSDKASKSAKSHQHGLAILNLAFDGSKGLLEFTAPNESILGFEHKARSASDNMKLKKAEKLFREKGAEIFVFEPSLGCQLKPQTLSLQDTSSSSHSETKLSYEVLCQKSPLGSRFKVQWESHFPALQKLDVQILINDLQKSEILTPSNNSLELK